MSRLSKLPSGIIRALPGLTLPPAATEEGAQLDKDRGVFVVPGVVVSAVFAQGSEAAPIGSAGPGAACGFVE
jgi:hypothetical protein